MLVFLVVASLGYGYRVRSSKRNGTDLREEMSLLHRHEGTGGENAASRTDD